MRTTRSWNDDWTFTKDPKNWKNRQEAPVTVALPHTWNAEDGQDGGNDYYRGSCRYEKRIELTREEKAQLEQGGHLYLEIPAAAMSATVSMGGKELLSHRGGYSLFRVDLSESIREGADIVRIDVDNDDNDVVYPQKADFTFYGGLYRGANLISVPAQHFELEQDGTPGIKVTPIVHEDGSAHVRVEVFTVGDAMVKLTLLDGSGQIVCRDTVKAEMGRAACEFTIPKAHLWDGVEDPYLYTATAALYAAGAEATLEPNDVADPDATPARNDATNPDATTARNVAADTDAAIALDEVRVRFGCRSFSFDPQKGFFLNGRSYPLRGVSRHQDRQGKGNALSTEDHKEDIALIREIGANTVRLAHYQQAQEFYDLCDETGLIVWAEIPYISMHMANGRENTLSQMRELIVQNYNHPSIAVWGLSNEITAATPVNEELLDNHRQLNELAHRLDPTRKTTMADVFMLETDSPVLEIPDINSYNLYFGWYLGEMNETDAFFDEYHRKYPDRVIGFSEYGADANPQYHSSHPEKGDYTEEYQALYHEHMEQMIEDRPWLWATHVWNMFDFAADGRDEGGKHGQNQKGLVTFDRKYKKDAFYLYKAAWNHTEPFVHICGRSYVNRAEAVTTVKVYSNLNQVSLFCDGREIGTEQGRKIFTFQVPITGEHTIEARAEGVSDRITIHRVKEEDPSYRFVAKAPVVNWFDQEPIDPDYYSVNDTLASLRENPESGAIVNGMMAKAAASRGDVAGAVMDNPALQRMLGRQKLITMLQQAGAAKEQVQSLNRMLQRIHK
jgi:beta-galactosidase